MCCIYAMGYHSAINKEVNPTICDSMNRPSGRYAKGNKADKERQILYDLAIKWNLKQTMTTTKNKLTDTQFGGCLRQVVGSEQNGWKGSKVTNF